MFLKGITDSIIIIIIPPFTWEAEGNLANVTIFSTVNTEG
jgi:hypothetical protein